MSLLLQKFVANGDIFDAEIESSCDDDDDDDDDDNNDDDDHGRAEAFPENKGKFCRSTVVREKYRIMIIAQNNE